MTIGGHHDTAGNEVVRIAVPGGHLTVEVTRSAAEPVLAINGISSGMSMGGFVAVELPASCPDRVRSLILVDGGFPMPAPPGLTPEELPRVFRDRLARLSAEALIADSADVFFGTSKWRQLTVPTRLLAAQWS